jgi:hypothetical protein
MIYERVFETLVRVYWRKLFTCSCWMTIQQLCRGRISLDSCLQQRIFIRCEHEVNSCYWRLMVWTF